MDISKTWMLLQIEELTRQLPHLKPLHDEADTQLRVMAEQVAAPKPKALPSKPSLGQVEFALKQPTIGGNL